MAAPTNAAIVKKVLANSEPSTHGPTLHLLKCEQGAAAYGSTYYNSYQCRYYPIRLREQLTGQTPASAALSGLQINPPALCRGTFLRTLQPGIVAADRERHERRLVRTMVALVLKLGSDCGEVAKRLDTREEEIGAAFYGRESRQALYLSSDRPLRDGHIVAAVLSADHRIAFIA